MKHKISLAGVNTILLAVVSVLFILFSVYSIVFENNEIYSAEKDSYYITLEDYSVKDAYDNTAPVGIRKEYKFTLEHIESDDTHLVFYLTHSYTDVNIDGKLIYSLSPARNNKIEASPGNNWVSIPLCASYEGKEVTVNLIPVYKSVLNQKIEFNIGSEHAVFIKQLKSDLPQIILSSLCILIFVFFMIMQLYFMIIKKACSSETFFLGVFSLLIGVWRITDVRFSSVMFTNNTKALGYISTFTLFIMAIPFLIFLSKKHIGKCGALLEMASLINGIVALGALTAQILGFAELRETIVFCHITLILDIVIIAFVSLYVSKTKEDRHNRVTELFFVLFAIGGALDLLLYFIKGNSSCLIFTLCAFVIYTMLYVSTIIISINNKAYVEEQTQLYNKRYWDEYIEKNTSENKSIGIMMLDLNNLKQTNDIKGHSVGDKMIMNFADIIRNTFDSDELLCRWGGDEFTVLVKNADREKMENYYYDIHEAVDVYNNLDGNPKIFFAAGYALSDDFPSLSIQELFKKADENMYINKQQWCDECSVKNTQTVLSGKVDTAVDKMSSL